MKLLCLAVQNAHTAVGLYDGEKLVGHWRLSSDPHRTADEWGLVIAGLIEQSIGSTAVGGIAVCSAAPAVLRELRAMIASRFPDAHAVIVGPGVRSGLPVLTDNPREVGTDRVANVVGAVERFGAPCIVVDFGTATTIEVVNARGEYVGGAIAPGVQLSLEALAAHGAQLRQVELAAPRSAIAKNTVEALQAGAVFGFAGQVDALVTRMCDELGLGPTDLAVVTTGSYAEVVAEHCTTVTRHEPWLSLEGLRVIYARNSTP
jgi:type III pantothenate kinase